MVMRRSFLRPSRDRVDSDRTTEHHSNKSNSISIDHEINQLQYWWVLLSPVYILVRCYYATRIPIPVNDVYFSWEPLYEQLYLSDANQRRFPSEAGMESLLVWMARKIESLLILSIPVIANDTVEQLESGPAISLAGSSVWTYLMSTPILHEPNLQLLTMAVLQSVMAFITALAELSWFAALLRHTRYYSRRHVVFWIAAVTLTNTGAAQSASSSLLHPAGQWMLAWLLTSTALVYEHHHIVILLSGMATVCARWSAGSVVLIPHVIRVLCKEWRGRNDNDTDSSKLTVSLWSAGRMLLFAGLVVMAAMRIVHGAGIGLTSVESRLLYPGGSVASRSMASYFDELRSKCGDATFYLGIPAAVITWFTWRRQTDVWASITSAWLWLALTNFSRIQDPIYAFQPLYPILCTGAVLVAHACWNAIGRIEAGLSRHKELQSKTRYMLHAIVWTPVVFMALVRNWSLAHQSTVPYGVFGYLRRQPEPELSTVCICGNAYDAFPSSFYLPDGWRWGLLPSSASSDEILHMFLLPEEEWVWFVDVYPRSTCLGDMTDISVEFKEQFEDFHESSTVVSTLLTRPFQATYSEINVSARKEYALYKRTTSDGS